MFAFSFAYNAGCLDRKDANFSQESSVSSRDHSDAGEKANSKTSKWNKGTFGKHPNKHLANSGVGKYYNKFQSQNNSRTSKSKVAITQDRQVTVDAKSELANGRGITVYDKCKQAQTSRTSSTELDTKYE